MKIKFLLIGLFFSLITALTSCFKEPEPIPTVLVTEAHVADMLAGTFCRNSEGLFAETKDMAGIVNRGLLRTPLCDATFDSTFSKTSPAAAPYTYSYALRYHYDIRCANLLPTYTAFSITRNGNSEGAFTKSDGNGNGAWTVTNLSPLDSNYTINGNYTRNGNAVAKRDANKSFSANLNCTLQNVAVSKMTKSLISGVVTFTITGSSSSSTDYTYNGQLTITSATTGSLVVNGKTFTVNLETGEVN